MSEKLQEKYELLIAEKPSAALKIAQALSDGKIKEYKEEKVTYYEVVYKDKKLIVACAVGHLFNLKSKTNEWKYPIFDIEWKEAYKVNKKSEYTKKYIDVIKKLSKNSDSFTICCDFDEEGSLIGFNALRFICGKKDGKRMKFSTLTKDEIRTSYENASKHLDFPQISSGETRHFLDYYYGISLSRALTLAIKNTGSFKIMSIGRVQGPTLTLLSQRELEIKKFKPESYWEIELITDKITAIHSKGKFWKKNDAENVISRSKDKPVFIKSIKKTVRRQRPPYPFDLTSLQLEAYKQLNFIPKQTLQLAQNLYIAGYISYPRTSSQKLPPSLGYKKILNDLSNQTKFKQLIKLLPKKLVPHEGPKNDVAHPSIYPTGEIGKLSPQEERLYELIVHRFLTTFGQYAKRETVSIDINVNNEIFITSGTRTVDKGWYTLYGKFAKFEEQELPQLKEGQQLKNKEIKLHEKETQPPKRYTQASIIKKLESLGLGTKATRSIILDTLYNRHYIQEKSIEVTDLGLKTINSLKKYVPEILDENLTRHFEEELEHIQKKQKKPEKVLEEAKSVLIRVSKEFKKNEDKIGKELLTAYRETQAQASLIGKCPNCKNGLLNIKKGPYGFFISCDHYEGCKTTFSIPKGALVMSTKEICLECSYPKIKIIRKGKTPMNLCINKECPTKHSDIKLEKNKKCPSCNGKLVIRKSIYQSFIGCENYPKCKHVEFLNNKNKNNIKEEESNTKEEENITPAK